MRNRLFLPALIRCAIVVSFSMLSVSCGVSDDAQIRVSENRMGIPVPGFLLAAREINASNLSLTVTVNGSPAPQVTEPDNSVTVSLDVLVNHNVVIEATWFYEGLQIARLNRTIPNINLNESISISNIEYIMDGEGMDEDLDGASNFEEFTANTDPRNSLSAPALQGAYSENDIGETGPAGGWIFWVNDAGTGGLESAPEDVVGIGEWGCSGGTPIAGADSTGVGTGEQNTRDILAGCSEQNIAAWLADQYRFGTIFDWFLPSKDELNLMYRNLNLNGNTGDFANDVYWSSSEIAETSAWLQDFNDGSQYFNGKDAPRRVRAVRAF